MNAKMIASLGVMAVFASLESCVYAQSPPASRANTGQYRLTGDSLFGVDNRTAQEDFVRFFEPNNLRNISNNNRRGNATPVKLRLNESPSLPNTPVFLVPAQSGDNNDGGQVLLDLGRE